MKGRILGTILAAIGLICACPAEQTLIRMMAGPGYGVPAKEDTSPRGIAKRSVFEEFERQNPDIRIVNAGGMELIGSNAESLFMMAMAGGSPPDVFYVNFRQYYNFIDQGFCRPLDDFVQKDPHVLDLVNPIVQQVMTSKDGKYYAIPFGQVAMGLYFRKDHFRDAGLDPNRPPKTWDELYEYAQKLTESAPGRIGFEFSKPAGYHWSNFIFQAGGRVVDILPNGETRSALDSPEAATAIDFFRKLTTETWKTNGKSYGPAAQSTSQFKQDIITGKASMWFDYSGDVAASMASSDIPPSLIGIADMPKGPVSSSHEINSACWAINSSVKDPKRLDACWRFIKFFASEKAAEVNTRVFVEQGMYAYVNPRWLKKFGYADLAAQVDPSYVKANDELFASGHPEPYGRNTQQVYTVLDNALDRAILEPTTPARMIARDAAKEMNSKLLGFTPKEVLVQQRAWATGFLVIGALLIGWMVVRSFRKQKLEPAAVNPAWRRSKTFIVWCLIPAALSLLIWSYYPVGRGLLIAFQDYRISKETTWVGMDNFISLFTQPIFYKALVNSIVFVALSIGIGFLIPIFLAIALSEIPIGKTFFRTLYYLPAMTSGIVIALLWRQFYDKSEAGLLNQLFGPIIDWFNHMVIRDPARFMPVNQDWLGSPQLAMFAVVLPGIWAAAGPGSILYLAALKNIPEERYEAADLDGANWIQKIQAITIPGIKPLMLINLLGVFIGGFKSMENIFVLTMGGPLYSTHTLGLEIWMNAFMFLKFGYAAAAAWVMGAMLIGFTLIQIRSLLKMKFTTVSGT